MHEFNQSLRYDQRMHAQDIRGSIAYAKALTLTGLLTKDEEKKLVDGLTQVGQEWKNGTVTSTWFFFMTCFALMCINPCSSKLCPMMKTSIQQMNEG